jgi:hypothetical protein
MGPNWFGDRIADISDNFRFWRVKSLFIELPPQGLTGMTYLGVAFGAGLTAPTVESDFEFTHQLIQSGVQTVPSKISIPNVLAHTPQKWLFTEGDGDLNAVGRLFGLTPGATDSITYMFRGEIEFSTPMDYTVSLKRKIKRIAGQLPITSREVHERAIAALDLAIDMPISSPVPKESRESSTHYFGKFV